MQRVFVRHYPHGTLAAHILGNVGEVSEEQLKEPRYKGLDPGDEVGQDGVEDTYDRFLRGKPGLTRIQVDALGQPTKNGQLVSKPPVPGDNLKLSIDGAVQEAGEAALAARGLPGGFITMNVHSGEILGLGSYPTFEPSVFTRPLTQSQVNALYRDPVAAPLTDRAIAGLYPTGSTFKLITAMAALESGVITPSERDRRRRLPERRRRDLPERRRSGQRQPSAWSRPCRSPPTSSSTRSASTCGTPATFSTGPTSWGSVGRPGSTCRARSKACCRPSSGATSSPPKAEAEGRPWSAGDNIQLATGQGDLQTNPLQMAIAYAALANGGTVVTPHVGLQIDDAAGRVVKEFDPEGRAATSTSTRNTATSSSKGCTRPRRAPGGTSYAVFGGFPIPVAGKTGTAQRAGHADQSWYVVLAPYPNPRIVTVVTMEEGGFGAESAAPAAHADPRSLFRQAPAPAKAAPKRREVAG